MRASLKYRLASALFMLALLLVYTYPQGNQPTGQPAWKRLYQLAEKIYKSDTETDQSDSIALNNYLQVISLLERKKINDSVLWDSYFKAGIFFQTIGKFDRAIPLFRQCLLLRPGTGNIPSSGDYLPSLYLGNSYYTINRFDSARIFYRQAENIAMANPGVSGIERLYNTQGILNFETGNYRQSVNYFEKAITLLPSKKAADTGLLINFRSNLATALKKLQHYEEALTIYKSLLPFNENVNELLHNIAVTYLAMGNYKEAIHYLQKLKYLPRESSGLQKQFNDLGQAFYGLGIYDSAGIFLARAEMLHTQNEPAGKTTTYGLTLQHLGDLHIALKNYDQALADYQAAICQFIFNWNDKNIYNNPVEFGGTFSAIELFDVLVSKAKAFQQRFNQDRQKKDLEAALQTYRSAYSLSNYIENIYESDEARMFINDRKYRSHDLPINLCLQLYQMTSQAGYLEQAFYFDEQNKASTLSAGLAAGHLKKAGGIPDSLLTRESNIREQITRTSLQAAGITDSTAMHDILEKRREAEISLNRLQEKFDEFPRYNSLKASGSTVSLKDLQQNIPANTSILSYHVGDSSVIAFFIAADRFDFTSIPRSDSLFNVIRGLYKVLQQAEGVSNKAISSFTGWLYQKLISPVEEKIKHYDNLVIIPDDDLHYIPFEALQNNKGEYLLQQYTISYNYSCSLLGVSGSHSEQKYSLLAMAPYPSAVAGPQSAELPPLPASAKEIEQLPGTILAGQSATKTYFIEHASVYSVLHLATHAKANDSDPDGSYIAFYPAHPDSAAADKLFIPEIYNLRLSNTRLTILSACETASGQLVKGEGLISLSRAFSYAGCSQIITSLWKADDNATAWIVQRIHRYLQQGYSSSQALQKARLDYLQSNTVEARFKTPAYWAHLRLVGQTDQPKQSHWWLNLALVAVIIALVFVAVYFLRNRKRVTKESS